MERRGTKNLGSRSNGYKSKREKNLRILEVYFTLSNFDFIVKKKIKVLRIKGQN